MRERINSSKKTNTNFSTSVHNSLQRVENSNVIPTQQDIENQQYKQNKSESTSLQNQAMYGEIKPEGQEGLTCLQTKMSDFPQQKLQNAQLYGHNFSRISVHRTDVTPKQAIQRKLTIGTPGDKYEQEADKVATQVVNQINAPAFGQPNQNLQREEMLSEDELTIKPKMSQIQRSAIPGEGEKLQKKPTLQLQAGDSVTAATVELENSIQQARSGGQPLLGSIRKPMERAFGADFSKVRIHADSQANQLNQSIQAKAFTTGQDVFFRQGAYQPESPGGQELIAHELTHVVQQNVSMVQRQRQNMQGQEKKENSLTLEEEQEWLQAKPLIQRQPETIIQRAWTGRRQLSGLGFLGKPWVVRKSGNIVNLRLFHEHIFFEDGVPPENWGHMGKAGLGSDTAHSEKEYSKVRQDLSDAKMREAVKLKGNPGSYSLLANNCQDYVQDVLRIYDSLMTTPSPAPAPAPGVFLPSSPPPNQE
jgi:Domain of unknown function (DUF4157)